MWEDGLRAEEEFLFALLISLLKPRFTLVLMLIYFTVTVKYPTNRDYICIRSSRQGLIGSIMYIFPRLCVNVPSRAFCIVRRASFGIVALSCNQFYICTILDIYGNSYLSAKIVAHARQSSFVSSTSFAEANFRSLAEYGSFGVLRLWSRSRVSLLRKTRVLLGICLR